MKVKKIVFFLLLIIVAAWLSTMTYPPVQVIAGLVGTAISVLFIEDFLNHIKTWLDIPIKTSEMTIFLYGRGGSGKTTLIRYIMSLETLRNRYNSSTQYAEYYRGEFYNSPSPSRRFNRKYKDTIHIADYKGQAPTEALGGRKSFMAQVNAIIFIVDVVHPDPKSDGNIMSDSALVEWLSYDTEEKIDSRIIQHVAYIGDAILSVIFGSILSVNRNRLRSVRLVINKIDIVKKLMIKGCLPDVASSGLSPEDYVRKKFQPIEKYIRDACNQNGILDVSFNVVSLTEGTGVRDLMRGLIQTHFTALRIR